MNIWEAVDDALQGEFAKDDNINARFKEAVSELVAVWWEVDVEHLESLAEPLLQVISDKRQGETLDKFQERLPF